MLAPASGVKAMSVMSAPGRVSAAFLRPSPGRGSSTTTVMWVLAIGVSRERQWRRRTKSGLAEGLLLESLEKWPTPGVSARF